MTVALAFAGAALIAMVLIDVTWTTVAAGSGAGPFTKRSSRMLWRAALALHGRTRGHTFLSAAGTLIVAAALITWITLLLLGWS